MLHRDIKPENVLLKIDQATECIKQIKLIDFGMACKFGDDCLKEDYFGYGTKGYIAPEVYQKKCENHELVDSWSLGILLFNLISGTMPFSGNHL